jgi:hypothetical protein
MAIWMALQIPNFTYPDTTTEQTFDRVVASAPLLTRERGGGPRPVPRGRASHSLG